MPTLCRHRDIHFSSCSKLEIKLILSFLPSPGRRFSVFLMLYCRPPPIYYGDLLPREGVPRLHRPLQAHTGQQAAGLARDQALDLTLVAVHQDGRGLMNNLAEENDSISY